MLTKALESLAGVSESFEGEIVMRFAVIIAATAALWVQPASAAIVSQGYQQVGMPAYNFGGVASCVTYPCAFVDQVVFDSPSPFGHLRLATSANPFSDTPLEITSLVLNGVEGIDRDFFFAPEGQPGRHYLPGFALSPKNNVLTIRGTAFVPDGSFGGDIRFSDTAVPEPATWAMMLLGFGFVGGAMRSAKRRQKLTVSYA